MEPLQTIDMLTALPAAASRWRLRLCTEEHPVSTEMLDRFAAGSATRNERAAVVRHLLAGCSSCSRHLGRRWPLEDRQEPEGAYDRALDRSFDRVVQALRFLRPAPQVPQE